MSWHALREFDKAIKDYSQAIQLNRGDWQVFLDRGQSLHEKKDYDKAIADYDAAIEFSPSFAAAYHHRGFARHAKKEHNKAIEDFNSAIIYYKKQGAKGLNGAAWLLAVCPEPKCRNGKEAIRIATRACDMTGWKTPLYLGTLAAAYAEAGNFAEAIRWQEKALEDKTYTHLHGAEARQRLELFRQKKPFRER